MGVRCFTNYEHAIGEVAYKCLGHCTCYSKMTIIHILRQQFIFYFYDLSHIPVHGICFTKILVCASDGGIYRGSRSVSGYLVDRWAVSSAVVPVQASISSPLLST